MVERRIKKQLATTIVLVVLVVAAVVGGLYWWKASSATQSELQSVKAKVGRLYLLPKDETPALVSVVDESKLSSSYLKQYAKTGDKLLLYQKQGKVIIYRPSIDKIVDIGVLELEAVEGANK